MSTPANRSRRPVKRGREHDEYDVTDVKRKRQRPEDSSPGPSPTPARILPYRRDSLALARTESIDTSFPAVHPIEDLLKSKKVQGQSGAASVGDDPFVESSQSQPVAGTQVGQVASQGSQNPFFPSTPRRPTARKSFVNPNDFYPSRQIGETPIITPFRLEPSRLGTEINADDAVGAPDATSGDVSTEEDEDMLEDEDMSSVSKNTFLRRRRYHGRDVNFRQGAAPQAPAPSQALREAELEQPQPVLWKIQRNPGSAVLS